MTDQKTCLLEMALFCAAKLALYLLCRIQILLTLVAFNLTYFHIYLFPT